MAFRSQWEALHLEFQPTETPKTLLEVIHITTDIFIKLSLWLLHVFLIPQCAGYPTCQNLSFRQDASALVPCGGHEGEAGVNFGSMLVSCSW